MQSAAREKLPQRKVNSLLVIGILFAPGIFVWFLLRQGHSTLARVIGFSWAGFMLLVWVAVVSAGPPDRGADAERLAEPIGQGEFANVEDEKQAVTANRTVEGEALQDAYDAPAFGKLKNAQKDERVGRLREGAARAANNRTLKQPTGSRSVRWITNTYLAGCPVASDWFEMQEAVERGNMSIDHPDRCIVMQPGTVIIAPPEGKRETITHKGHEYEKASLQDGRVFWTDEMDDVSLTRFEAVGQREIAFVSAMTDFVIVCAKAVDRQTTTFQTWAA
ncbi:hypothetical protein EKN06_01650 [Croceicoccus ponticola]|uniref:Uncharacterized protein n=1 Tax=Croceicoccus ponticola TaxID=2217664 RepID=A0A437H022_9SPHN|nr:hypothetical protein [Croceicoccus ponticola]RVQ68950.1 hypothetical protein EKN06_01650 [Croceicoccus ponticola]